MTETHSVKLQVIGPDDAGYYTLIAGYGTGTISVHKSDIHKLVPGIPETLTVNVSRSEKLRLESFKTDDVVVKSVLNRLTGR